MQKKLVVIAMLVAITMLMVAQLLPSPPPPMATAGEFDRRAMLRHMVDTVILPAHQHFLDEASELEVAALVFEADPTQDNLFAWQQAWRDTSYAWEGVEVFEFRSTLLTHTAIERQPISIERIERYIVEEENIDAATINGLGTNVKGLATLEYLIFADLETVSQPQRLRYAVAVSSDIQNNAQILLDTWLPEGFNFAETFTNLDGDGSSLRESLSMLINQMSSQLDSILQMKLGGPLGTRSGGEPAPNESEAPYSDYGIPQIISNIETLQLLFTGGEGLGLDDYLNYLDAQYDGRPLSLVIIEQFDTTLAALNAIDQPLGMAVIENPDAVQLAYDEVQTLMVLIRVDMAAQLGVTITFSDNDGD